MSSRATGASWFQRFLLPGLAFKAVVIGGGYATGRELAEFFLAGGPWAGIVAMLLAMLVWSLVCAATFAFARATHAYDYRGFFTALLGRGWWMFELVYLLLLVLILAVMGAAAGELGRAVFGWPGLVGSGGFVLLVATVAATGNAGVERLFKWAAPLLYGTYLLFLLLSLSSFGDRIVARFSASPATLGEVAAGLPGGLGYAGYNLVAAVVVLPMVRHLRGRRDALIAGAIAGPLAMLPALLFFICMVAWTPAVADVALPSDYLLQRLDRPLFRQLFQAMVFVALLETGIGVVHALNERVAASWRAHRGERFPVGVRMAVAAALLLASIFLAGRFGLVALIASGYRGLSWALLAVYVLPLLILGPWRLRRRRAGARAIRYGA
ncbi:hypothetical protein FKV24_017425 [Lysobacter maris]|uniref:Uncharacterized protein n=1 Tax=Marilutibacter maris TaxID=1605891 RepID=A0A507ZU52_9GAMM|nr:hypothetical protein [Lysobacter maris]KAB8164500.1 hypothetical protein FKV24_017425 [Lysobacter maris]